MGYIIPAGYARVTLEFGSASSLGSQVVTGFGVQPEPTEALLDTVQTYLEEEWATRAHEYYTVRRIEARNDVEVLERAVAITGLQSEQVQPPNVSALMKFTTGLVGRANRGRMYFPGLLLDDDVNGAGEIDDAVRASLQLLIEALVTYLAAEAYELVILHSDVGLPTLVTGVQAEGVAATQRRRLRA